MKSRPFVSLCLLAVVLLAGCPDANNDDDEPLVEETIDELAARLAALADGELDLASDIYAWVCENIDYDGAALQANNEYGTAFPSQAAAAVYAARVGVCSGYAHLYAYLCDQAGLDCEYVVGYAKTSTGTYEFTDTNHAWNIVTINDERYIVDATWGAGYLDASYVFHRRVTNFWFMTVPALSLYTHLPETRTADYELIASPISLDEFEAQDYVASSTFTALCSMGAAQADMADAMASGAGVPTCWYTPSLGVQFLEFPLQADIASGYSASFRATSAMERCYFIDANAGGNAIWTQLSLSGGEFSGTVTATDNQLSLVFGPLNDSYTYVLRYNDADNLSPDSRSVRAAATAERPWDPLKVAVNGAPPSAPVYQR